MKHSNTLAKDIAEARVVVEVASAKLIMNGSVSVSTRSSSARRNAKVMELAMLTPTHKTQIGNRCITQTRSAQAGDACL